MKKPAPKSVRASRSGAGASFFEKAGALLVHAIAFKNKKYATSFHSVDQVSDRPEARVDRCFVAASNV